MITSLKSCLSLSLILACCSANVDMDIANLYFADIERAAIRENQIKRTIIQYHSEEGTRTDTVMYDDAGRNIYESYPYNNRVKLMYDGNGLVTVKEFIDGEYIVHDSAEYKYKPDSLILYQSWSYDSFSYEYRFDKSGRLVEVATLKKGDNRDPIQRSRISYENNRPVKLELLRRKGREFLPAGATVFYYSGNKLDSIIQTSPYQKIYKTVFDKNGLAKAKYYDGQLEVTYLHEKR